METEADNFVEKLLYPLEKVEKGVVFKIDDYILDNNGYINKNYDILHGEEAVSPDKSLVIYYAAEDYIVQRNDTPVATRPATEAATEATQAPAETTVPATTESKQDNSIDPDFKAAMDSYEKFFDEYVAIMKKYKANPSDLTILADYAKYMGQYADMMEKMEKWENEDLNAAETAYYIEVQAEISKKLLEVAQ